MGTTLKILEGKLTEEKLISQQQSTLDSISSHVKTSRRNQKIFHPDRDLNLRPLK